jgi:hypothetical protein
VFLAAAAVLCLTASSTALGQVDAQAGQYDYGKMWTFEYAPADYFAETYGFDANAAWFERARLSALRVPRCSSSFVSPNGLMVTNHHCVRSEVVQVSLPGETLLDSGFIAYELSEERSIPGYYADQLIAALDVTEEVFAATDVAPDDESRGLRRDRCRAGRRVAHRCTRDRVCGD